MPELAPGAALPRGGLYILPTGMWTRDRQHALALRRLYEQAVGLRPWEWVPIFFNPEL